MLAWMDEATRYLGDEYGRELGIKVHITSGYGAHPLSARHTHRDTQAHIGTAHTHTQSVAQTHTHRHRHTDIHTGTDTDRHTERAYTRTDTAHPLTDRRTCIGTVTGTQAEVAEWSDPCVCARVSMAASSMCAPVCVALCFSLSVCPSLLHVCVSRESKHSSRLK
jgi:hypothetical protein